MGKGILGSSDIDPDKLHCRARDLFGFNQFWAIYTKRENNNTNKNMSSILKTLETGLRNQRSNE